MTITLSSSKSDSFKYASSFDPTLENGWIVQNVIQSTGNLVASEYLAKDLLVCSALHPVAHTPAIHTILKTSYVKVFSSFINENI